MIIRETLYKKDNKGKTRVWLMEIDGSKYRTVSGILDGKLVESGWKEAFPKNEGKKNGTTAEEQAVSEVNSLYTKQKDSGYTENIKDIDKKPFFEPMLAATFKTFQKPVYVQAKLDGVRCITTSERFHSRSGKNIPIAEILWPELKEFCKKYNVILDGELYNHELHDDFNQISSLVRKEKLTDEDITKTKNILQYHIYDCFLLDDPTAIFENRREFLGQNLPLNDSIFLLDHWFIENKEQLDQIQMILIEDGYEGCMVRDPDSVYENKRSKNLQKYKNFIDEEFEIVEVVEGQGNWAGYAKSLMIRLPNGQECNSGVAGTQEFLKQVLKEKDQYIGGIATVKYMNKTPDGVLRFPVATKLYKKGEEKV